MNIINEINKEYEVIIVGSGFSGSVIAHEYAKIGKKVLLIEKRDHIAGNMYDYHNKDGILIHKYGPHIFHTKNKAILEYLSSFTDWRFYEHRVLGYIDGQYVPIPFNFKSIDTLMPQNASKIKDELLNRYGLDAKLSISELRKSEDKLISELGEYIFEKVFLNYTIKQWGIKPSDLDEEVLKRVPINIGYDDRYFKDTYQFMPLDGYTKLFENMLTSPNIDVMIGKDANELLKIENDKIYFNGDCDKKIYYTGALDELFDEQDKKLQYRSLEFLFETYKTDKYQSSATVNYPNDYEFTRITEFKILTGQQTDDITTIVKEFPTDYTKIPSKGELPYYPILNPKNIETYNYYKQKADKTKNLFVLGRLGEYKYYNMDEAVENALKVFQETK